ncbi:hypothetical protein BGW39_011928 [Mortierella sp. 14UC]|nr:hypothetical protein BGW39_011928 [Mortierella sp. 14UC]
MTTSQTPSTFTAATPSEEQQPQGTASTSTDTAPTGVIAHCGIYLGNWAIFDITVSTSNSSNKKSDPTQQQTVPELIEDGPSNTNAALSFSDDTNSTAPPAYSLEHDNNKPANDDDASTAAMIVSRPPSPKKEMECNGLRIGKHICIGVATF